MPGIHRIQDKVGKLVISPFLGLALLCGIYLASKLKVWSAFYVQWGLGVIIVLGALGETQSSVSISLVGDRAIRRLNREHRGRDRAPDVLSFALCGRPPARAVWRPTAHPERLLGDIVISLDTAARQAREYQALLGDEVARLLVHGLLHLLGHDHERPRERSLMLRKERELAGAIGLAWPY